MEKGITPIEPENFEALAGRGIKGTFSGQQIVVGTRRLMEEMNVKINKEFQTKENYFYDQGKTLAFVSIDGTVAGIIALADEIKDDAIEAVTRLKDMGLQVGMITGDNQRTTKVIAEVTGIKRFFADVLPEDKVNEIKKTPRRRFDSCYGWWRRE